jgi:hypothetical protein
MIIEAGGKRFVASYFPFFRSERHEDFDVWSIRLADGSVSETSILIFDSKNPLPELHENARWFINEYVLEDDIALTKRAIEIKQQLMEIFHEQS